MCRFSACKLAKSELSKKCAYKKNNIEHEVPWNDHNIVIDYKPSDMLQPKDTGLPVIIDGKHIQSSEDRIFHPMLWSLIPSSYKGNVKEWKFLTHNARIENLNESKTYSVSLSEGKRCIVVMEGFYEFKKTGNEPAEVYFFQSPNENLLKAAGLFSTFKADNGENLYTCTIITSESESNIKTIHHRTPLFLNNEMDIVTWLDYKNVSSSDAVSKIKIIKQKDFIIHKTAKIGSREPVSGKKVAASKSIMSNWLNGSNKSLKRKAEN